MLRTLAGKFPKENFLYVGDTARLPYGTKSPETVRAYSLQVMEFLFARKVKAVVIACSTASSQVLERNYHSIPVYNVIEPGAKFAVRTSMNGKIGILGTRATIESSAYERAIQRIRPATQVISQICPLFVPLAEEGLCKDPITDLAISRYLGPLLQHEVDTVILGCTHYPLLRAAIQDYCGSEVRLVESGEAVAEALAEDISRGGLPVSEIEKRTIQILLTDYSLHTAALVKTIMDFHEISTIGKTELSNRA